MADDARLIIALVRAYAMKISTTLLSYDHGIIRQVIDVLGEVVKGDSLEKRRGLLSQIVDFLKRFMDEFHHEKEERFFFPATVPPSSPLRGEVDGLIRDHSHARELLMEMGAHIDDGDLGNFSDLSLKLVEHMTDHVNREELRIFPKIEEVLSPEEDKAIRLAFGEYAKRFGDDFYGEAQDFADKVQSEILGPAHFGNVLDS